MHKSAGGCRFWHVFYSALGFDVLTPFVYYRYIQVLYHCIGGGFVGTGLNLSSLHLLYCSGDAFVVCVCVCFLIFGALV